MSKRQERCETCRFWVDYDTIDNEKAGDCHRYPPRDKAGSINSARADMYPLTLATFWCGEWQESPPPPDESPITFDGRTVRFRKLMKRLNCVVWDDLCKLSAHDILLQKNTGPTTITEVKMALHERGLKLKGD